MSDDSIDKPLADFGEEAKRIVAAADSKNVVIRIMGACAVRIHCPKFSYLHDVMKRAFTHSDIDFISYSKYNQSVKQILKSAGYIPDERIIALHGRERHIYFDRSNKRLVDVFFDKMEMSHTLDYANRLELDSPTLSVTDLFLQKLQIVQINVRDITDSIVLLREHDIADKDDSETINGKYVAELLAKNWGFWYTVNTNFRKIKDFQTKYEALPNVDRVDVAKKIDKLSEFIEKEKKSLRWRIRAKVGPRTKWYNDVEERRDLDART
jgi:hypothetical protein